MVIRVLAGVVPMITGALIFSGVIPVGKWVMGSAAPDPAQMMRIMKSADARLASEIDSDDTAETSEAVARARTAGLDPGQVQEVLQQARRRQDALRRNRMSLPDAQDAGWSPSSGGWNR